MNLLDFQRNELQMDYSSESYQDFERDFYRYSYKKTTTYLAEK